ncbi:MAG: 16S rRNA (cytosine(1402)-N(4))-methyltransferase RsmH, partial [Woeseiaceae bacterium]|nr:16S rRNA (cytosine(1402)-N(4))-methyltransferase RsmH [Woeseiaceae bacterium]
GESAADWLARVDERELKRVLKQYGEEAAAAGIARAIVRARSEQPVRRTRELADIVERVVPRHRSRRHPATKTFQAIRMVVNDELAQIASALEATIGVLAPGGRLCVISFHSLEDRLVKRFMRDHSREAEAYRGMPEVPPDARPTLRLIGKPIAASDAEQASNPRSRSARLRVAERVA